VIVASVRTPVCKAGRGGLKDTPAMHLLLAALQGVLAKSKIDPKLVNDIVVGTVLPLGSVRANECRMAAYLAGFPDSTCVYTLNRQCSSSLQAIASVAASITAGHCNIGIGAGVESMTKDAFKWDGAKDPKVMANKSAKACLLPMGLTSENVASHFKVTREEQDALAVASHHKAAKAIKAGKFKEEIVPVVTKVIDAKTGEETEVTVAVDDGVRGATTAEQLAALKPAFKKDGGTTTAGNSSQVSDGAAASLIMTRAMAQKLGLPILGVFRSFAVSGVPPEVMGIGPAFAIPDALKKVGLTINDIDVFEINEAFASQAVYCAKTLKVPMDKLNPNGGAVALGHPLGATGARMTATLLHELKRSKKRFGVVSMCIGSRSFHIFFRAPTYTHAHTLHTHTHTYIYTHIYMYH
jgi:acetyl-CoA acyltransferase 1